MDFALILAKKGSKGPKGGGEVNLNNFNEKNIEIPDYLFRNILFLNPN